MTHKPPRPPKRPNIGCWLIAFTSILIAATLTLIALFLPPISLPDRLLSLQYSPLNAASPAIAFADELRLSLPADAAADFAVKIDSLSANAFQTTDGDQPAWLAAARENLPPFLALQGPLYLIESRGAPARNLQIELKTPADAARPERLSLYGWDGEQWRFIPSIPAAGALLGTADFPSRALAIFQTIPSAPVVLVSQEVTQDLDPTITSLATILSPAGLRPTLQGSLIGSLAPGGDADAAYLFMPLIRNFTDARAIDIATIETLISHPRLRADHVARITDLASYNSFDGVFIDYRGLSAAHRDSFTLFVSELAASLSQRGLRLGAVVAAERGANGLWGSDAFDWRPIGEAVDYFQLRAIINPLNFMPDQAGSVNDLLRQVTSAVARNKVLLGLSASSIREVDGTLNRIGWHDAFAALGDVIVTAADVSQTGSIEPGSVIRASLSGYKARFGIQEAIQTTYIDYQDESSAVISRIWLADAAALRYRMDSAWSSAIAGIAFDDLLAQEHSLSLPQSIRNFRARQPASASPVQLKARWSIEGQAGALDQVLTNLDADLVLTLEAPDGNYAINWSAVAESGAESGRRGAVLPLFRPSPTPTSTPTPTPVPRPVVVRSGAISAPSGAGYGAAAPPAGSINIAIGGHVTSTGSGRAILAMQSAGMTWMKIQSRFYQNGPPDIARDITTARNNGFKILVGTVGDPAELARGGDSYIQAYTDWLQRIAGYGADAIEVWNEPNIDREWPRGQISGTAYARMLATAYQKIKQVNSATMVISAAPAPTGAENAFPGQVMNDDRWLREMVSGGGLNYLDCVGAHYNEGIIPPSQTSGDPRQGDYYTRYFYGMLNTYYSITGRPICFTELGYLTSDGLPGLPPYFSWAKDVTVPQQAAWLAQAAALASQSGKVRLLIVWNIDFSHYDADPQAGFAIIRPDGSCPACSALAGAR